MINCLICFLLCFTSIRPSQATPLFIGDTLKTGESLNSSTFMVSPSGEYTLGFDSSGYLALTSHTFTLWVANPNYPIENSSSSSVLTLQLDNGVTTLYVTRGEYLIAELFSSPSFRTNVEATLTDSGNFVLQEVELNASNSRVLWQSFDEPTVALMPGMALSNDRMYSQKNGIAGVGPFHLSWDSDSLRLLIWNDNETQLWWSSGRLSSNENRRFKYINIPEESKVKYNFTVDDDGSFVYALVGDQTTRSAWILNTKGGLYDVYNKIYIARAGDCDGFNTIGGCERWDKYTNGNYGNCYEDVVVSSAGYADSQFIKHGSFRPKSLDNSVVNATWTGANVGSCNETCLRNCDCLGFDFESPLDDQSECRFWSRKLSRFVEDSTSSTTGFVLKKKPRPINKEALNRWLGIGITVPTVILAVVLCNIYYMIRERKLQDGNERKIKDMLDMMNANRPTDARGLQNDGNAGHDLSVFQYASIVAATCNFSDENKLGQGGFGSVYKGKLVTGQQIAVKRLSKRSAQGISEFKNELILIHELQHMNLVQLFGFCIHGEERILVYEYLPNKSLDYFLFDAKRCHQLDWNRRFSIIEGIAQGLLYLHKYSRVRIIHRDLKASNVLLDEMMNPKISDFGLARIFANDEQEAMTMKIAGTRGYMSPEYIMGGNFSTKSDIYSFGVLMLEILSGRKSNSFYDDDRAINLVGYAWDLWKQGAGLELFDQTISYSCDEEKLLRCVQVALLCVEENAVDRPTMLDVISMLTNGSMSVPEPRKPAFCIERNVVTTAGDGSTVVESVNGISNTYFDGR